MFKKRPREKVEHMPKPVYFKFKLDMIYDSNTFFSNKNIDLKDIEIGESVDYFANKMD